MDSRRKFLKSGTGTMVALAGLAGCMGNNNDQATQTTTTQTTTTESSTTTSSGSSDYPSEEVTFVAWASRGGGSDTITRQGYVRPIRKNNLFPVSVRAINKVGGGGETGMKYTLNQPADGHTVLNVSTNLIVTPLSRDIGITYKDFTPIARMGIEPEVLVIRADDDRFSNIKEFREYARNNTVMSGRLA